MNNPCELCSRLLKNQVIDTMRGIIDDAQDFTESIVDDFTRYISCDVCNHEKIDWYDLVDEYIADLLQAPLEPKITLNEKTKDKFFADMKKLMSRNRK